jgi:hypothetical protein
VNRKTAGSPFSSRVGIIVAGMHRSGTSATARVINLLGADIAQDLMPAMDANEKGYWESKAVAKIHDGLLHELGSSWDDPMPLPDRWAETGEAQRARCDLAREIERQFSESRVFVTKDPRVSRLLPLWLDLFDDLAITPVVVIAFRNPAEVASSLCKRDQFAQAKSLLIYARCHLDAELASRRARRIFVHYEQLLHDWRPFSRRLREVSGSLLPPLSAESTAAIGDFLDCGLHHNRCPDDELAGAPGMAPPIVELYQRMREAYETGNDSALCEPFDRVERVLAGATELFRGLVTSEEEKRRLFAAEEVRNAELNAALQAASAEMARLKGELEAARCRTAELTIALAAESAETARLKSALEAVRCRSEKLAAALDRRSEEAAQLVGEVAAVHARATELHGALDAESTERARLTGELEAAHRRSAELAAALDARSAEATAWIHELNAVRQSTSWRVTVPVRWIGRRLPRSSPSR